MHVLIQEHQKILPKTFCHYLWRPVIKKPTRNKFNPKNLTQDIILNKLN